MSGLAGVAGEAVSSWLVRGLILMSVMTVAGCQARPEILGAPVSGYNHTSAAINWFSVNGAAGPNIGPFQGGLSSQVCCTIIPVVWNPRLRAVVKWEKDPFPSENIQRDQYGQIVMEAYKRHAAKYSTHEAVVEIPQYTDEVCAVQVHFLPCDQVRISTTCYTPAHRNYPDHAYFKIKESTRCSIL